jgi:hypothetical protein
VGVGITSIIAGRQAIQPRADAIAQGFAYDPSTTAVTNGATPYRGRAAGEATLEDLLTPRLILSGNQIGNNMNAHRYLEVTLRIGVLPQYFTPATFSSTITVTISTGP